MEDVNLMNLVVQPSKFRVGIMAVKYHDLVMKCDLVLFTKEKDNHLWVRMPERWLGGEKKKFSYCLWPSKVESDKFQRHILKQVEEKYGIDVNKARELLKKCFKKDATQKKFDKIKTNSYITK